jgi:hypothetical protein
MTKSGHLDIVLSNDQPDPKLVLLHFDCRPPKHSPSATTVAIADIDRDGANDIVYASQDKCQSVVYLNDGKAGFERTIPWGPPDASTRAMAVANFDGDGYLDIAACHENMGCFVYLNDGKGHFSNGILIQGPAALPYSMIAADLSGDKRPDIIVGYVEAPGIIFVNDDTDRQVPFGDGKGAVHGMAAADLDGDGLPDIVVARSDAPSFVMLTRHRKVADNP